MAALVVVVPLRCTVLAAVEAEAVEFECNRATLRQTLFRNNYNKKEMYAYERLCMCLCVCEREG